MAPLPRLTTSEWRTIKAGLPPALEMPQRHADRDVVNALFHAEAAPCSLERVPKGYGISHTSLTSRRRRWRADGTWQGLLIRGEQAILRMRRELDADSEDPLTILSRSWGIYAPLDRCGWPKKR
jgi:transposase